MKDKTSKSESVKSTKYDKVSKIDIKGGKMTFNQRNELGRIMQSDIPDHEKFEQTFICLHKKRPEQKEYEILFPYYVEIIEGLTFWMEQENTLLKYEPTAEEEQAGATELTNNIKEFGTVKALAKAYSQDPDVILQWEYAKVFGILYTDLEEHKFQVRYNKVMERKYKAR